MGWLVIPALTAGTLFPQSTIFVVRHADRYGTEPDPDLTPDGRSRAAALGRLLSDSRITRIFTSDAVCTHQTAAPTAQQYRAAFTTPADYTCGNSGLNILRGPGFSEPEFALEKSFLVKEGKSLTFRAEDTNALNHVNLGQPSATLGAAGFGTIRGINGNPRIMQRVLKSAF